MNTEYHNKCNHHLRGAQLAVEENNQIESVKTGFCFITCESKNLPGSFKHGDCNAQVEFPFVAVDGSVMDRLAMIDRILDDMPAAMYPLVRENIAMNYKRRMEWELQHEPNGVTEIAEEAVEDDTPQIEGVGIVERIKTVIYSNLSRSEKPKG